MGIEILGGSGGGSGGGIQKVADTEARTALSPTDGTYVIQLDTHELWLWNGASWVLVLDDGDHAAFSGHIAAASAAHAASAISFTPAGTIAATNVQAAIAEVASEAATDLGNHLSDTTDAHDASAISVTPTGNIASTDVQAALAELDGDIQTLQSSSHVAATIGSFGSTPNADGMSISGQAINLEPANSTNPGAISTSQQDIPGAKAFASGVKVGATGALSTSVIFEVNSTTAFSVPMPVMTSTQRNGIASPAVGMMLYNSTTKHPEFYNGSIWHPIGHSYVHSSLTLVSTDNITPADARSQIIPVIGTVGVETVNNILVTGMQNGDELLLIGESDTLAVEIRSAANVVVNGSCVLGLGNTLKLVHLAGMWYEVSRST